MVDCVVTLVNVVEKGVSAPAFLQTPDATLVMPFPESQLNLAKTCLVSPAGHVESVLVHLAGAGCPMPEASKGYSVQTAPAFVSPLEARMLQSTTTAGAVRCCVSKVQRMSGF